MELTASTRPDVVLMDIRVPAMDGIEATRRITASPQNDYTRILILTTFDLDEYVFSALRAGAGGFLLKDTPPGDLLNAIRVIAAGNLHVSLATAKTRVSRLLAKLGARDRAQLVIVAYETGLIRPSLRRPPAK
ncbi:response regulator transcription factor [Actinomadura rubrisoli]|uniref:Response regulator transcription factor n=1 Tax=Actinomadura rubrisoli TaxID=2530368 RepID=A0A4R5C5E1_9ACTN|nr:response regulator transcription factor [Actinomadura rubrisoli]